MSRKEALMLVLFCFSALSSWSQGCRKASIYFHSNKYETKRESLRVVDSVLTSLHSDTLYLIEIHGHTDQRGSSEDNIILAQERISFITKHIQESGKFSKVRLLNRNFGEENPGSEENKLNRRVDIFIKPLNPNGSITATDLSGNQVSIDYSYFRGCGYCLSDLQLNIHPQEGLGKQSEQLTYIRLLNNCDTLQVRSCYSVEFRFPYEQFNTSAKLKVPKKIWVNRCGPDTLITKDSIRLDSSYSAGFTTRFDHLTNEYVVTHPCFSPSADFFICCRNIPCNDSLRLHLTDTIRNKRTAYYYKYFVSPKIIKDSTIRLPDSNYVARQICPESEQVVFGLGYRNGEVLFANKSINAIARIPHYDVNGFFMYFERHLYERDYQPLEYLESNVRVKLPKGVNADEAGFYIEELDYFIPMEQVKKHVFIYKNLNFPYSFGIKTNNEIVSIDYLTPKKKYHKRSKELRVKIKSKHL